MDEFKILNVIAVSFKNREDAYDFYFEYRKVNNDSLGLTDRIKSILSDKSDYSIYNDKVGNFYNILFINESGLNKGQISIPLPKNNNYITYVISKIDQEPLDKLISKIKLRLLLKDRARVNQEEYGITITEVNSNKN